MVARTEEPFFVVQDGIRMDLLKALYQVMLVELPGNEVLEFWRRHPIVLRKGPLPAKDFLRFLWRGGMGVQPAYFWSLLHDLESCLSARCIDGDHFFLLLNHGSQGGPPLEPGWVAKAMPSPQTPYSDPREWLLSGMDRLLARLFPGSRVERFPADNENGSGSSVFLFQPFPAGDIPASDFRLFPGHLMAALPKLFGWSPFDPVEVLADMRSPGLAIGDAGGGEWRWKGDVLRYRKRTMGSWMRLETFVDRLEEASKIRSALGSALERHVLVMERDFRPSDRTHPVLREGCAYGAPVTLARLGYTPSRRWEKLAALLAKTRAPRIQGLGTSWEITEILHQELLNRP